MLVDAYDDAESYYIVVSCIYFWFMAKAEHVNLTVNWARST